MSNQTYTMVVALSGIDLSGHLLITSNLPVSANSADMYDYIEDSLYPAGRYTPGVHEWVGSVRTCRDGSPRFVGRWRKMSLYPGRIPATKKRRHWGHFVSGAKAPPEWGESDHDYMENNRFAVVRFLDTMNERRGK